MQFTPQQHAAIIATNRELLISAAAGSGKTAVLVERILHMISARHYSIDKVLIVTYTRAAAAELRERLETRIADAALSNLALRQQADLVSTAQISTIHAYCQKVIRENFRFCQIDPQFTLGDDRSLQALYQDSMEETLDQVYTVAKADDELSALVSKLPEKDIANIMDALYRFLISRPNPLTWLKDESSRTWTAEHIGEQPMALAFMNEAALRLEGALRDWAKTKTLSENPAFPQALCRTIDGDLETLNHLCEAANTGFGELLTALKQCRFVTQARTKPATADEVNCVERYKAIRAGYKKTVDDLRKLLPDDLKTAVDDMNMMRPAAMGLYKAMELLFKTYQQKKIDQAMLDFNDLEHMTLAVLSDPQLRALEAARFDAVFVDEYQDVSAIQEAILNGLKRPADSPIPQSYFYVGDVKQSIYRFRLAEPRLFMEKQDAFSSEPDADCRKIILNKNFRSREGVLNAVNRTFSYLMDRRVTEINYDTAAMLYPGSPSIGDPVTELHICSSEGMKPIDVVLREAQLVAEDILATVGQPVLNSAGEPAGTLRYRDIAILMPVVKNVADKVEAVLTAAGIPVYTDAGGNALGGEEVVQATQHLLLLDNLMNDTALIAELRSPLFDMSESDLCNIRLGTPQREQSFLSALRTAAESDEDLTLRRRCAAVLAMLEEERFLYQSMSPDEYLWDFLMRSGLYAHYGAQPGGKLRQANLRMLCQKVGEFALTHRDGLQGLLESIATKTGGDSTSPTVVNPWEDVVRIMTIHKSKGLEFPTVYLMGLGNSIAKRRATKILSCHGQLGMGLMYMNEKTRVKRTTLMQSGIQLKLSAEERAEKARLLYVAMTRPKNRLVMIGSTKAEKNGLESTLENAALKANEYKDLTAVRTAASLLEWLLLCVDDHDDIISDMENAPSCQKESAADSVPNRKDISTSFPQVSGFWRVVFHIGLEKSRRSYFVHNVKNENLASLLDFAQKPNDDNEKNILDAHDPLSPLPSLSHLPTKIGVTALCRAMEDQQSSWLSGDQDAEETPATKRVPLLTQRPRLMSAVREAPVFLMPQEENIGLVRGTLTHKLLSLISLDGVRKTESEDRLLRYIKEEIQRMTIRGLWTEGEAAMIDHRAVASFFLSNLGRRALASSVLHREWSFNLRLHSPIETVVQGVIDLCFLENDRWVLVDFKTDRIKEMAELWTRYCQQLNFYKLALEKATPNSVAEIGLYSLQLGKYLMK